MTERTNANVWESTVERDVYRILEHALGPLERHEIHRRVGEPSDEVTEALVSLLERDKITMTHDIRYTTNE